MRARKNEFGMKPFRRGADENQEREKFAHSEFFKLSAFNQTLTFRVCHPLGALASEHTMDGISWTDLDADEQRTLAMLSVGFSAEVCDSVTLLTLKRIGLIKGSRLTLEAEQLISAAVRHEFAA